MFSLYWSVWIIDQIDDAGLTVVLYKETVTPQYQLQLSRDSSVYTLSFEIFSLRATKIDQ